MVRKPIERDVARAHPRKADQARGEVLVERNLIGHEITQRFTRGIPQIVLIVAITSAYVSVALGMSGYITQGSAAVAAVAFCLVASLAAWLVYLFGPDNRRRVR